MSAAAAMRAAPSASGPEKGADIIPMPCAMRTITLIAIHCTATMEGRPFTRDDIDAMHRRRGFNGIGYHYLIELDGKVATGRPLDRAGSHILGHNANSIGVCYVGGISGDGKAKDTRTTAQMAALARLVEDLAAKHPKAIIRGHRDLSPDADRDGKVEPHEWLKMCPCFDVVSWCKGAGINPR